MNGTTTSPPSTFPLLEQQPSFDSLRRDLFSSGYHPRVERWFKNPEKVVETDPGYRHLSTEKQTEMIFRHNFSKTVDSYVRLFFNHSRIMFGDQRRLIYTAEATMVFNNVISKCIIEYSFAEEENRIGPCIHRYIADKRHSIIHYNSERTTTHSISDSDELDEDEVWQTQDSNVQIQETADAIKLFDFSRKPYRIFLSIKKSIPSSVFRLS